MVDVASNCPKLTEISSPSFSNFKEVKDRREQNVTYQHYDDDQECHDVVMQINYAIHYQRGWILKVDLIINRNVKRNSKDRNRCKRSTVL
jgi:hypothetical protein